MSPSLFLFVLKKKLKKNLKLKKKKEKKAVSCPLALVSTVRKKSKTTKKLGGFIGEELG